MDRLLPGDHLRGEHVVATERVVPYPVGCMAVTVREHINSSTCHSAQRAVRDFGWYVKQVAYGDGDPQPYAGPVDTVALGFHDRGLVFRLGL